ncbi:MAG: DUF2461 family protein [Deltaproteobacteria bacterium]|nr:DUF2461 family protein [Deltaproteobacteria bacterium]
MKKASAFSKQTIDFLAKAGRQKSPLWLDKNRPEFEKVVLAPLKNLAGHLKTELQPLARDYRFPQKGIGRLKRPAPWAAEHGGHLYRNWMTYSASVPRTSRFEHNPNLFFMIDTTDPKDTVLVAGGLYMPSSKQLRALREAIAVNATAFEQLFATKEFSRCFPGGFSDERISSRPPRGFDPNHPRMPWLKLQAFFVWKPYTRREFTSRDFPRLVARDFKQILRLNALLDQVIRGYSPKTLPVKTKAQQKAATSELLERLADVEAPRRPMDF